MNCLFIVKHKETERAVKVYGVVRESFTKFFVWNKKLQQFTWELASEFELMPDDFIVTTDGSYEVE